MGENEKTYLDWEGLLEYHGKLETKLSEKANTEDLADVATSGDYNDLENTPTNVSLFTNDAGYMTSEIDNTNGHDYVEIGGIKWATMNLGARNITDIGLYFQWGDILGYTSEEVGEEKNFTWEDYKFNPSGDGTTFSKYNSTDLKTSLDTVDDAAASVWGSDWRVPTTSELQTLSNVVNVSWTNDYEDSGVPGLILTDKEDSSKVLFLPATGVCNDGSIIDDDTTGFYWSKSLGSTDDKGLGLGFDKTNGTTWEYSNSRSLGFAIRPVLEGPAKRTIMGVTQLEKDKWNNSYSKEEIDEELESMELVTSTSLNDLNTRIGNTNTNLQNLENSIKYDNVLGTTISSAERTAWNAKVDNTSVGSANGVASLDSNGKVPSSQLPSYVDDIIEGYYVNGHFYDSIEDYVKIGNLWWKTKNIGANNITDTGLYFQWGDTQGYTADQVGSGEGQKYFYWTDYKYCDGTSLNMTKYNSTDNKTVLEASDDAVQAACGGNWRMPTTEEFAALGEAVNTTWTQVDGVYGRLCTDKTDNSKTLFFPACGKCNMGSVKDVGSLGFYYSSSLLNRKHPYDLGFNDNLLKWLDYDNMRCDGLPVRGVSSVEPQAPTEIPGESGKIYVDLTTNKEYRWSGSQFTIVSETLALGETSSTAYRGDRGKIAYDHSQSTHARTDATKTEASETNGNIKINGEEITVYTHPGSGTNPHGTTKSDVGLGNVGNFKAVSTEASQGLSSEEQSNARANIGAGTSSFSGSYDDLTNKPTIPDAQIQSDWDLSDTNAKDFIKNKPTIPDALIQSDWNQSDNTSKDFIKNKPGIGVANGLATLDSTGKVPSSQLPSYVDDVIEGYYHGEEDPQSGKTVYNMYEDDEYTILITPESGKIYLDIPSSNSYRWSGSQYVLIGAPYDLPIASANTLGGVKVGDNLSIDQNGVLSAANEVQIGGETPSSDSDVEIYIDTTEDDTVEVYTKQLQDGKFIVIKDLNSSPTESTLTYTENGTVKNFKVGDEIRVPDAEADNGYTFYKLYALTTEEGVTIATWDKLGAGSGAEAIFEHLIVSLTGNQIDSATDLIGATIVVTNTDTEEKLLNTTWQGDDVDLLVFPNINYSVEVGDIDGYATPSAKTHESAMGTSRTDTFTYQAELVTVTCTADDGASVAGKTVTIDNTQFTLDATGVASKKVAIGDTYTVSLGSWGTYDAMSRTYTANSQSRSVSLEWSSDAVDFELPSGVKFRKYIVGANSLNDAGQFFSWGNIVPGTPGETDSNYSNTPGGKISAFSSGDATYDPARAVLGGSWRTPTKTELSEFGSAVSRSTLNSSYIVYTSKKDQNKKIYVYVGNMYNGNYVIRCTSKDYEWYGNISGQWGGDMPNHYGVYFQQLAVK